MKKLIVLLFGLIILVGCNTTKELAAVTNIRVEDNLLKWDEVENAEEYFIYFMEDEITTSKNYLELVNLNSGEYEVTIYALAKGYKDSLKVTHKFTYEAPEVAELKNVRIDNGYLKWDEVEDLTYVVSINSEEHEVLINEYDLSSLEVNKFYELKVKALNGKWSNSLNYENFESLENELELKFYKIKPEDLKLDLSDISNEIYKIKKHNDNFLNETEYEIKDNLLIISANYLSSLENWDYVFVVYTSEGKFNVTIQVLENFKPYLKSNNTVEFTGEDVEFEFEIYDGKIVKVSVNDITEDDYVISGNKLIIKKEYISKIFEENLERNSLIIMYHLSANTQYVLGSVQIKRN